MSYDQTTPADATEPTAQSTSEPTQTLTDLGFQPADDTAAGTAPVTGTAPVVQDRPRRSGPAPFTVLIGLFCMVVAGLAFASEVSDFRVDWAAVGPVVVVGIGAVLVLLGLLGLRGRRS